MEACRGHNFRDYQGLRRNPGQREFPGAPTGRAGAGHRRVVQRAALAGPATPGLCCPLLLLGLPPGWLQGCQPRCLHRTCFFLAAALGLHQDSGWLGLDPVDDRQWGSAGHGLWGKATHLAGPCAQKVAERAAGTRPFLLLHTEPQDLLKVRLVPRSLADGALAPAGRVQKGAARAGPLSSRGHGPGRARVAERQGPGHGGRTGWGPVSA